MLIHIESLNQVYQLIHTFEFDGIYQSIQYVLANEVMQLYIKQSNDLKLR